ncbi:hypothetical protein QBC46DRAFT_318560 [Diplogelasinospora grovesii]|uniref:Glycosyl transferase CAP10 domain-containing protein n=1 Tax=Diplogelasinospora grovesii TaxID=303347 RepID=A0AAN6N3Y7_9PEZI|nr:hypothetical protein QBC46DRAFT_318560 [Diplogelasinospora grovesii]
MARNSRPWGQISLLLTTSLLLYILLFFRNSISPPYGKRFGMVFSEAGTSSQNLFNTLNLSSQQCNAAFPNLTHDIGVNVALGPFTLPPPESGPLQVRIRDGQLYILHSKGRNALSPELRDASQARTATLHQLHRAILTRPEPLPDTILALNFEDQPFGASFTYSRPAYAAPTSASPPITRAFLMPHFSFWAWTPPFIGSFSRAAAAIDALEAALPFMQKDKRVVWRGTAGFNSVHHPHLRRDLLRVAGGRPWADVQALDWPTQKGGEGADFGQRPGNAMMIEDFCRYKYAIHTEGITYSGRFQFLQMCNSVILTPPVAWLQHTTHLIWPVFSSDLNPNPKWELSEDIQRAWPKRYEPEEANIVFVAPDWSDLEATIAWLETHPAVAEGIAKRQRELFVGRGYLSPSAETCYWRALVRGWSKVVRTETEEEGKAGHDDMGIPWETFALGHEP